MTSSAYSFYELPESRNSSGSQSRGLLLGRSQYDGAASSRPSSSGGAYHSIRLNHNRFARGAFGQASPSRAPSQTVGTHPELGYGVSPLPARPYGRAPIAQQSPRLSTSLLTDDDLIGNDQDASRAVQRGLTISPLERVEDRATAYLDRIAAGMRAGPNPLDGTTISPFQHQQVTDVDASQIHQRNRGWPGPIESRRLPSAHHSWINAPSHQRRDAPTTRTGQRSSENMPVGASSPEEPFNHTVHTQPARVTFRPRPNPPSSGAHM
jgi:hypothetical protein